ncbi:MAG: isochorismate synthase [Flavobacteriaceae bacterium]
MDLDILFSKVQQHYAEELPFVVYRKPGKEIIRGLFQKDDKLYVTSNYKESGFVFSPFDTDLNAILFPFEKCKLYSGFFLQKNELSENPKVSKLTPENKDFKDTHIELIQKGIDSVKNGELKKVVLSRKEEVKIKELTTGDSIINLFEKLLDKHPLAFVYCWYHPSVGLWLGATPESLFSLEKKTFRTMALAGTQRFTEESKVMWSDKDKEEQSLVTQFLENTLEKVVPILMISKPTTFKAGNVIHLKTDIGGTINTRLCDIPCLIKRLHPTPAVCGLPKDKATQFLKSHENYDREFYTGFLGEINLNEKIYQKTPVVDISCADLYVNLRCMKINKDVATLFVGGGITKDSIPNDEWKETVFKADTMMQILS